MTYIKLLTSNSIKRVAGFGLGIFIFVSGFLVIGSFAGITENILPKGKYFHQEFPCISFNPYRTYGSPPTIDAKVNEDQLRSDLQKIKEYSSCVRTYSATGVSATIPRLASEYGMTVILGAFLSSDKKRNKKELQNIVLIANANANVSHVIVGNEVLLHLKNDDGYMSLSYRELVHALRWVRKQTKKPVSYGDVAGIWLQRRDLLNEVDFITAHFLPYWKDIDLEDALSWTRSEYDQIVKITKKPIFMGEVGWPTRGAVYGGGLPSPVNQANYLKKLTTILRTEKWSQSMEPKFNVVEAFDQPWKAYSREGRVARHWGIFDAAANIKSFRKTERIVPNYFAVVVLSLASLLFVILYLTGVKIASFSTVPQLFWWSSSLASTLMISAITIIGADLDYMIGLTSIFAVIGLICINAMIAIEAFVNCKVMQDKAGVQNQVSPSQNQSKLHEKFVSIHMPCANEPPEQVIESIRSICKLDYKNFEILVIINNTFEESMWMPVEKFCQGLETHVRFINLGRITGYKAGALNRALKLANPDAELIAIVDADYLVEPDWLRKVVPLFSDENVASVQCPQDYRGYEGSVCKTMMRDELQGFFDIGMVERAKVNAPVQHGTLLTLRKDVLIELGSWNERSICEDAELGLRILATGRKILYLRLNAGRGLLPASQLAYARQRYRWVFGGLRIIFTQWRLFLPRSKSLTTSQKFYFFWGWFPWLADATFIPFFVFSFLIGISIVMDPKFIPSPIYTLPLILFVVHRLVSIVMNYRNRVQINRRRMFLSIVSGLALTSVVSFAAISAMCGFKAEFISTLKGMPSGALMRLNIKRGLWVVYNWGVDSFIGLAMLILAFLVLKSTAFSLEGICWSVYLIVFSLPGLASTFVRVSYFFNSLSPLSASILNVSKEKPGHDL